MELLSPAGSREAVTAAVQSGAGAVYLGFGDYNARRGAQNFTRESLAEAVAYCHVRGVKVYLTLNTLLSDGELPGAVEEARFASEVGADAVLVNTAIAVADDPVMMARAFRMAVEAGLLARQSGPGSRSFQAQATSPLTGFLEAIS